jgi:hypothetical protein
MLALLHGAFQLNFKVSPSLGASSALDTVGK